MNSSLESVEPQGTPTGEREPRPPRPPDGVTPPEFSTRRLVAGIGIGTGLAVAGIAIAMAGRGGVDVFRTAAPPNLAFMGIAFLFAALDTFLGGFRLYYMAHRLAPEVRVTDGVRADLANRCLAGITPWQTGGGAAQLYVLARAGLSVSGGVAVGTINFLVSTIVLIGFGFIALAFLPSHLPRWLHVSTVSTLAFLIVLVLVGVVILGRGKAAPASGDGIAGGAAAGPASARAARRGRIGAAFDRGLEFVKRSLEIARGLLRSHRQPVLTLFPITAGILGSKLVYTYFVFRAFEPQGHFSEMFAVLVILILSLFFAPTPGASGVAEGAGTAFLASSLSAPVAVGFVLYWRMLTLYLPVVIGGMVLLHQLGRDSRRVGTGSPP